MTEFRTLTPQLTVAGQITEDDLRWAAEEGYRTVINNRPDGEDPQQPSNEQLEKLAHELGLEWHYQPVQSGVVTDQNAWQFGRTLSEAEGPVLAFCRTGTRCTMLWALSRSDQFTPEEIVGTAYNAGYDLSGLRPRLEQRRPQ